MLERRSGVIVNMIAYEGGPLAGAYAATKMALRSLAFTVAREIGNDAGVAVFSFVPGIVDTPADAREPAAAEWCGHRPLDRAGDGDRRPEPGLRRPHAGGPLRDDPRPRDRPRLRSPRPGHRAVRATRPDRRRSRCPISTRSRHGALDTSGSAVGPLHEAVPGRCRDAATRNSRTASRSGRASSRRLAAARTPCC